MRLGKFSVISQLVFLLGMWIFSGCTENLDNFGPQSNGNSASVPKNNRVIVLNEGNFMFGNGSVSMVNLLSEDVSQEVFISRNGYPLGDVPQSLLFSGDEAYIVVNNSGKIEVVDRTDFTSIHTMTGFTSPRQMALISQNPRIAWVTDLYANKMWVVDLDQKNIVHTIPFLGWSENILVMDNNAIILNKTDSMLHVFQTDTETKIDSLKVSGGISDCAKWSDSEIAVLSPSGVFTWNLTSQILDTITLFSPGRNPLKLAVDPSLQRMYFIENEVYKIEINEPNSLIEVMIDKTLASNYYNICINIENSNIFVTDSKDFVQPGKLLIYNFSGKKISEFPMGINPQWIALD
jgi:hypothetical protein